ncbi:MAG: cysteine desulfurase NifS [Oscillospiraceae bacterium]|nr:cysteine desulfurase NifS [Oscillospiraceae bacterium]
MSRIIYADHAATTALSPAALEAMTPYLTQQYGNPSSLYRFGQQAKAGLEDARTRIAACLGAEADEVYFTSGGTEADNWAIRGVLEAQAKKGNHVITSAIEHHAVLHTLDALARQGLCQVTQVGVDAQGRVNPEEVRAALRPDTVLISIMAANNEIGTIEPVAEIGAIARQAGVLFHTDAVQAVGHIPVQVNDWKVDLLSLSGHKFHGPRGIGALYVRKPLRLPPLIFGGGQEKGRRSGTEYVAGAVGMAAALQEAVGQMETEGRRLSALRDRLIDGILSQVPRSSLTGPRENRLPGTASFVFACVEGESILLRLDSRGVCASSGSACSSASLDPSHVLLSIGLPHEVAHGSLRLSLGRETTAEDVDDLLTIIPEVVAGLRAMSPLWCEN